MSDADLDAALNLSEGRETPTYLRTAQAAARLGLQPSTLEKWRSTGGGPLFVKLGRAVRYRMADLDVFATERLRAHTAQQPKAAA